MDKLNVSLFAIDEAHCISFWGHDFRPEYTKLTILKEKYPQIPVIALTATADKVTRRDILKQMAMENAQIFISSFDRPNLTLSVMPGRKRFEQIVHFLRKHKDEPGIIYCLSRKNTEAIAEKLRKLGFKAKHYHAGETSPYRAKTQDAFLCDKIQIICATIAFGMGIDKSNVRWVVHYNMPKNIESFYQEIGRAGRDRLKSDTLMFYSFNDFLTHTERAKELPPEQQELQLAKIERMKQYAEADICRRRILLSYFNETVHNDCGNCDVCNNPPERFDGTVIAQKALSVIARTDEKVAIAPLVDILRGMKNKVIIENQYDKIKTFGAGIELKREEWIDYIYQLLNSGFIDIAYDEGHVFKLNTRSWDVLKGNSAVSLVKFVHPADKEKKIIEIKPVVPQEVSPELFEKLKNLRRKIAEERGVPAFVIFSDKTLHDMAAKRPQSDEEMLQVSGVGQFKFKEFGVDFLGEIRQFVQRENRPE